MQRFDNYELVKEKCDYIVRIDMLGEVGSLNVSVAAGVVVFELAEEDASAVTIESPKTAKAKTEADLFSIILSSIK